MMQFNLYSLVHAAMITFSSFYPGDSPLPVHSNTASTVEWKVMNDPIKITENDYKLLKEDEYSIDLKIVDRKKLKALQKATHPVIQLTVNGKEYVVRENYMLNASFPANCDAFYTVNQDGKIVWVKTKVMSFRKIPR